MSGLTFKWLAIKDLAQMNRLTLKQFTENYR